MLQIVEAVSRLPTDTIATEQELQQLTAHELKERLAGAGGSCDGCLEKAELVRALLEVGGSSSTSCCICCDDYVSGDVLRILPCKVPSSMSLCSRRTFVLGEVCWAYL